MTKILHFAAAAILACAVMACSESGIEELNPNNPGSNTGNGQNTEPVYITAGFDEGAQSRLIADDDGLTKIVFKWEVGDQIVIGNSLTGTTTSYKFTAISVSDDGKIATFESPQGYTGTPAIGLRLEKTWNSTDFSASTISGGSGLYTADQLADAYRMYAIYDAEKKRFVFKQLNAIMRFEVTLPATETAINSFRLQVQDQSTVLHTSANYDISSGVAVASDSPVNSFYQEGLKIPLDNDNKAVVYVSLGPTDAIAQKKLDIIINKTQHTTQTCLALTADKVASIRKPVGKWVNAIYSAGLGTAEDPYIVSNENNLRTLGYSANGTHGFTKTDYTGKYFALENDITLTTSQANPWEPIGQEGGSIGRFYAMAIDGRGHTIFGDLYMGDYKEIGIFGSSGAPISNLTYSGDVYYSGTAAERIGSIIGFTGSNGNTTNCKHIGSMNINYTGTKTINVGGVQGEAYNSTMDQCTQTGGKITVTVGSGGVNIGGVCGWFSSSKSHRLRAETPIELTQTGTSSNIGAIVGARSSSTSALYECSTFDPDKVTIVRNGSSMTVKPIGNAELSSPCPDGH